MVDRRSFGKIVGVGAAGASLTGWSDTGATADGAVGGPTGAASPTPSPGHASFGRLRRIEAGELSVGYAEAGPAHGPAVVLLHGWPYDIHSFVEVAPLLAARGHRVIVPYLRGHGTTRFRSARTFRNAQQSVVALDIVALMDALEIEKAVLAGFDWGARTADIIAVLRPERCRALVSVGGYLITDRERNKQPLPPKAEWAWWYQYYFATERGRLGLKENRADLARLVWTFNSPTWHYDDAVFDRTAKAFDNPDYVAIVIHNYRWRLGLAQGDPRYDRLERQLAAGPVVAVPTVTLDGRKDPFTAAGDGSSYRARFSGPYAHRTLADIGHNVPQEAPEAFARAVAEADGLAGS
ncbi:alpha/beta hydrolase [Streptomyces sp. NBC_01571]|uniref:alpha/beta fold hydrolase n=1 Tax=Streptomyces sp. NBC_01571 TaxID=2975883 RepID=UPI002250F082|nr:alpha/beta hydrolase [Streptomyces sp. NBC_01571]MCX4578234.1 alpha/beta hydrolase [Streptomyces sp. NBC_01571]